MRQGILMLAVAVVGLVSCDATPAVESMHTQVSLAANIQPTAVGQNEIASRRLLRTAETIEERGYESLKKILPWTQSHRIKIIAKDGKTFTDDFVHKMLNDRNYMDKTFAYWAKQGIELVPTRNMLRDMTNNDRMTLLTKYSDFLDGKPYR